jgi:hypothetical protein
MALVLIDSRPYLDEMEALPDSGAEVHQTSKLKRLMFMRFLLHSYKQGTQNNALKL